MFNVKTLFLIACWFITADQVLALSATNGETLLFAKDPVIALCMFLITATFTILHWFSSQMNTMKLFTDMQNEILKMARDCYIDNHEADSSVQFNQILKIDLSVNQLTVSGINIKGHSVVICIVIDHYSKNWCRLKYFSEHSQGTSIQFEYDMLRRYNNMLMRQERARTTEIDFGAFNKYI